MYDEDYAYFPATEADAHREWHFLTGNPIGQTTCPWDACDPYADALDPLDEWAVDIITPDYCEGRPATYAVPGCGAHEVDEVAYDGGPPF